MKSASTADFGLPTIDDERGLAGIGDPAAISDVWSRAGCPEVIVKLGRQGSRLPDGTVVPPAMALRPVDSSGAGDAFSAGYLGLRLRGGSPAEAAHFGNELAGWVIMRNGAIPHRDHAAPYGLTATSE